MRIWLLFFFCIPLFGSEPEPATFSKIPFLEMPKSLPRPLKVYVSLAVNQLMEINEKANDFEAEIEVSFRWTDPSLAFDKIRMGTSRLEYERSEAVSKLKEIWQPELYIDNLLKPSKIDITLFIYENGVVEYNRTIEGKFKADYQLASFPFDSEDLPFVILSKFYDNGEIVFDQTEKDLTHSAVSEGVELAVWQISPLLKWSSSSLMQWNGKYYSEIIGKIHVKRSPFGYLIILVPLMVIILMPSFLTLYQRKIPLVHRLEIWSAAVLALVAISLTINLRFPTLEPDSLVNRIFFAFLLYQFIMILITVSLFNDKLAKGWKNQDLVEETRIVLGWCIPAGFILLLVANCLLVIY